MLKDPQNYLAITLEKQGPVTINSGNFPFRYGRYSELKTTDFEFVFNLNGEIKLIRGLGTNWPHPAEQLKRTDGNDWVYYTVGDDSSKNGIVSWLGEYYLPCLPYPSNSIWAVDYQSDTRIMDAFAALSQIYPRLELLANDPSYARAHGLIRKVLNHDDRTLHVRTKTLHTIIGGRISVLPPDTRHVDYEVIPITVADGCQHNCSFCCVKSGQAFQPRKMDDILTQIGRLKTFYGHNIVNYQGLFLGNHDALAVGGKLLYTTAARAHEEFGFDSRLEKPYLFLFGSVDSLLASPDRLFNQLNNLPFYTYINIGLESVDQQTLQNIGKPLKRANVIEAFQKMLEINHTYKRVEMTANFVIGEGLPAEHYDALQDLLRSASTINNGHKGAIYLSPLKNSPKKKELLPLIRQIKKKSRLPVFAYLIQRL